MAKVKRWIKRALFRLGSRTVSRDAEKAGLFSFRRKLIRTPKVKGRRLALKPPFVFPDRARKAEEAVKEYHRSITPTRYHLVFTKRYPPIKKLRTEQYYDRPSLKDFIEGKKNRRVRAFLAQNKVNMTSMLAFASEAYDELERNCLRAQQLRVNVAIDVKPDQFLVDRIEKDGKLTVIMIDV